MVSHCFSSRKLPPSDRPPAAATAAAAARVWLHQAAAHTHNKADTLSIWEGDTTRGRERCQIPGAKKGAPLVGMHQRGRVGEKGRRAGMRVSPYRRFHPPKPGHSHTRRPKGEEEGSLREEAPSSESPSGQIKRLPAHHLVGSGHGARSSGWKSSPALATRFSLELLYAPPARPPVSAVHSAPCAQRSPHPTLPAPIPHQLPSLHPSLPHLRLPLLLSHLPLPESQLQRVPDAKPGWSQRML